MFKFSFKDILQFCALVDFHRRGDRQYVGRMFYVAFYERVTGKPSEYSFTTNPPEVALDKWETVARAAVKNVPKDYAAFEALASLIASPEVHVSDSSESPLPLLEAASEGASDW